MLNPAETSNIPSDTQMEISEVQTPTNHAFHTAVAETNSTSPDRLMSNRPVIPYLMKPTVLANFVIFRNNMNVIYDYEVQIDAQETVSGKCYDVMTLLCSGIVPISREEFIRMWKTLILKRTQDVYTHTKFRRPDNFIRLMSNETNFCPAPLYDLLMSLGSFTSTSRGIITCCVPPPSQKLEEWFVLDDKLINKWILFMSKMQKFYAIKPFPNPRDIDERPLPLLCSKDDGIYRTIYSYTNEPTAADAYIKFCHDEMFVQANQITNANCGYVVVNRLQRSHIVDTYISSYML